LAFTAALVWTWHRRRQESNKSSLSAKSVQACRVRYTIFAGDQVEKFNLEVIGVLDNFLGPKQSIILVQLKGPKVEHTRRGGNERQPVISTANSLARCH